MHAMQVASSSGAHASDVDSFINYHHISSFRFSNEATKHNVHWEHPMLP